MSTSSIILVDFDNIFLGLWELDREVAFRFGGQPHEWLERLTQSHLACDPRRWLVARCYLNPAGYVHSPHEATGRLYFSRFRPGLVRAGFEVIDCPAVARSGKNAADIRIVIDALDLLGSATRYEEFVIASGDSDFTPLLQRIRAHDRRITVMSPGYSSAAYTSLADKVIDFDAMDTLLMDDAEGILGAAAARPVEDGQMPAAFVEFMTRRYLDATTPLNLSSLSSEAARKFPDSLTTGWFGCGSFTGALRLLDLPNARFAQHFLWNEERHHSPVAVAPDLAKAMPQAVSALVDVLDLPKLGQAIWPRLYDALARYASDHEFAFAEATSWTRERLAAEGVAVARPTVGYVVRGSQAGGAPLNAEPPPDAGQIAAAFCRSLIEGAERNELDLDAAAREDIAAWVGATDVS